MKTVVEHEGKTYGLGKKPHKQDPRDFMLRDSVNLALTITRRYWGMVDSTFRIDQGQEGTCVGHGCTNVLLDDPSPHPSFPEFDTVDKAHQFARKLYFDATGDSTYQEGAYTRDALDVLVERGQIASYHRLGSVGEILGCLANQGPVVFGSTWYYSMFNPYGAYNNQYLKVNPASGEAGGHLYCLTGFDTQPAAGPDFVRMENSWGRPWAKNGTARITVDDLRILYDGDAYFLTENQF